MNWEFVSILPPGSGSRTILARLGPRFGVLRQLETEPFYPPRPNGRAPTSPVLPLLEVAVVAGLRYGVYDVLRAVSLREVAEALLAREQLPPVGLVARVMADAARAVTSIAPARPHGGLSDSSLLVGFDGETRLLDFGAPRTSRFLPRGRPSFANDVFALGAVLHSALTGFSGHYGEAAAGGLKLPAPSLSNPDVPPALDALVLRATARDAVDRPLDGEFFAKELVAAMGGALFATADVAALVEKLLGARREQLERLLSGESPREDPPSVPWLAGGSDVPRPPPRVLEFAEATALGLGEDLPTQPVLFAVSPDADAGRASPSEPQRAVEVLRPVEPRPLAQPRPPMEAGPSAEVRLPFESQPSSESKPSLESASSRSRRPRVVLAVVLATLAIIAVGVHELAPEVIVSIRARLGIGGPRVAAPTASAASPRATTPEEDSRPAKEREINVDREEAGPSKPRR